MVNHEKIKHELEHSLVKMLGIICRKNMKINTKVVSIDGLFGVTIEDGHTFLFNINEKNGGGGNPATPKRTDAQSPSLMSSTNVKPSPNQHSDTDGPVVSLACTGMVQLASFRRTRQQTLEVVTVEDDNPSSPSALTVSELETNAQSPSSTKRRRLTNPVTKLAATAEGKTDTPLTAKSEQVPDLADMMKILKADGNTLSCTTCGQVFKSKSSGILHVKFKHFNIGSTCSICSRLFRTDIELGDHVAREHLAGENHHRCHHCKKYFKSKQTLREHVMIEHCEGESELQCRECGKHYKTLITLKEHVLNIHQGGRFGCHLCGHGFRTSKRCRQHLAAKHPHCEECGMSVFTLKGHVCSSTFPLPSTMSTIGAKSRSGHASPSNFKLDKKYLGDLAKSVVEKLCADSALETNSKDTRSTLNNTDQNGNGNTTPTPKMDQQADAKLRPQMLFEHSPNPGEGTNKNFGDESDDDGMRTPSPSPSDLSDEDLEDEGMMMVCDTCDTEFATPEDFHAHVIQHPWCHQCGKRVLELAAHRPDCRGPVPVMLRRNNHGPAPVPVTLVRKSFPEPYNVINID